MGGYIRHLVMYNTPKHAREVMFHEVMITDLFPTEKKGRHLNISMEGESIYTL